MPTVSYAVSNTGGFSSPAGTTNLTAGGTVTAQMTFSEAVGSTQPTVQFKNDSTNLGSAVTATGSGTVRTATYTVGSSDNVSAGNFKYDITNESSITDAAGNPLATASDQTVSTYVLDTTAPTISSATYNGSKVVLTLSEPVYTQTPQNSTDFTVTDDGSTVSISSISFHPVPSLASNTITITLSSAIAPGSTVTLAYTRDDTVDRLNDRRIKDVVDIMLANITSQSVTDTSGSITVSAISGGYVNGSEDDSTLTISGTSSNVATGATVTVKADGSGTDVTKTGTTNASGAWSVSLSSSEVQGLDASTPGATGETITVTATVTDSGGTSRSGTKTFTYDPSAPTISSASVSGTTLTVTMSENIYAGTSPDNGDFTIAGGGNPTVSSISGLPTAAGSADNSFILTLSAAFTGSATIKYTQSGTAAKRMKDVAGNATATSSAITISGTPVAPSAPSLALSSPTASPGTDSTPTIRVTVDSNQQNGTVQLFSNSTCTTSISSSATVDSATEDVTTSALTADTPYTIYAKHANTNGQGTCSSASVAYEYDGAVPTVSSASASGTTVTVTMSEEVYASTAPDADDFTIVGGGAPAVNSISGLESTKANADNSFTLTLASATTGAATLSYTKDSTKTITDTAGRELASASGITIAGSTPKTLAVSAVSGGYVNASEDDSTLTISGTSTGFGSGTTVTVGVDGSGTDVSGKTGTTNASGDWSVSLTASEVRGLDASTPGATGETITVTASATGATDATKTFIYDPTVPTISGASYNGSTVTVTMSEDVFASTTPDNGDFSVTDDGSSVSVSAVAVASTSATASATITLTTSSAIVAGSTVTLGYTRNSTVGKRIADKAGNTVASVSGKNVGDGVKRLSVSAVSGGYVNASEAGSNVTVSGSSVALTNGTSVTVAFEDSDSDTTADVTKTTTVGSGGSWSVTLTGNDFSNSLEEGTVNITASATGAADGTNSFVFDKTAPAVSSMLYGTNRVVLTLGESVTSSTAPTAADFAVYDDGTAVTVSSVSAPTSTAGTSIVLTVSGSMDSGSTVGVTYTPNSGRLLKDTAGNSLAGFQLTTTTSVSLTLSPISGGFVGDTEDESSVTVSGTSSGIPAGTAVSVAVDDSDSDTTADVTKSGTIASGGSWSVSLTSANVKSLQTGPVSVTVSSGGATATGSFIYDKTAPTLSYSTTHTGGITHNSGTLLGIGDKATVIVTMSEEAGTTAPTVQVKSGTTNLGSPATGVGLPLAHDYSFAANAGDSAGTTDALDLGTVATGSGIVREALGNGYVYKVTRDFSSLRLRVDGASVTVATLAGRSAASKPTAATLATHGTQFVSYNNVNNAQNWWNLDHSFSSGLEAGSYFWFYPNTTLTIQNRRFRADGSYVRPNSFAAAYTITEGDDATAGNLKYQLSNRAAFTDTAGNPSAATPPVGVFTNFVVDATPPVISAVVYGGGNILTVRTDTDVWASSGNLPLPGDFTIAVTSGTAPTVSTVYGVASTAATASNSFSLALNTQEFTRSGATISYTQNSGDTSKRLRDFAGNPMKSSSGTTILQSALVINEVSGGFVSGSEDDSALTVSGTSSGLLTGSTVTVSLDGSGTDVSGLTGTTDSGGDWSVSLSSSALKALMSGGSGKPVGERITITASATGVDNGTASFIYDIVAPGVTTDSLVSSGAVNASEDDRTVFVTVGAPADAASASFTLSDGTDSVTGSGARSGVPTEMISDAMSALSYVSGDQFGSAVARKGNLLAIGAPQDDTGGTNRGAVYLIKDSDGDGDFTDAGSGDVVVLDSDTANLTIADYTNFGTAVAFGDGMLAVGGAVAGSRRGSVFLIKDGGDGWASVESADVAVIDNSTTGISLSVYDSFGSSVAFDGGLLAVGAPGTSSNKGRVYLIADGGDSWGSVAVSDVVKVDTDSTGLTLTAEDHFGSSVAFDGGRTGSGRLLAVGSPKASSNKGRVYVIADGGDSWGSVAAADVTAIDNDSAGLTLAGFDLFGSSVAFGERGMLAVGAISSANNENGEVYLIADGGDSWGSVAASDVAIIHQDDIGSVIGLTGYGDLGKAVAFDTTPDAVSDDYARSLVVGAAGVVHLFDPALALAVASDTFEKDSTATAGDGKLAEGTVSVSATATDRAGNTASAASGSFVYDIGTPSVSSVSYVDRFSGGSALSTATGRDDIYTVVVFSEKVAERVGSGDLALPKIAHRTGSGGSESVYRVVASGATLASGECKETGTGSDDGKRYTCYYRSSGAPVGQFKTYVTRYADRAYNFGSGQGYATLPGSVSIAAAPPLAPTLALKSPASSPGNDSTPTVTVTVDSGQVEGVVELFSDSACSSANSLSDEVTVSTRAVDVTVSSGSALSGGVHTIYAKHTNNSHPTGTCSAVGLTYRYDNSPPTITRASLSGGTSIVVTMSEAVWGAPDTDNFRVLLSSGTTTVSSITGLASTAATADTQFTLTLSAAIGDTVTASVDYTQDSDTTKRVRDVAGNAQQNRSSVTVTREFVGITTPIASDNYVNAAEDNSALSISGTSSGVTGAVTVAFDDIDTGTAANVSLTATPDNTGNWSVSLSAASLRSLRAGQIDITASANSGSLTGTASFIYDPTAPTVSSVGVSGTTLTFAMSEPVYAATAPTAADFTVSGGGAPAISSVAGIGTTVATADGSFDLTLAAALSGSATVGYSADSARVVKDKAGNTLASVSGLAIVPPSVTITTPISVDGFVNGSEDDTGLTVNGTSAVLGGGTTVTVSFDGAGTDTSKTGTVAANAWSVSLTAAELQGLDASTPNADGETITVTATATDTNGNTLTDTATFIYDPTAPTNNPGTVSGTASINRRDSARFTGTTDSTEVKAGDRIALYNNTNLLAQSSPLSADSDGATPWQVDLFSGALSRGTHTLSFTYTDAAGNQSPATASFTLTVKGSSGGGGGVGRGFRLLTPPSQQTQQPTGTETQQTRTSYTMPLVGPTGITQTHRINTANPAVLQAQKILNTNTNCPISLIGPDSIGKETGTLNILTAAAIVCYQSDKNLPQTGTLTPQTYAALMEEITITTVIPTADNQAKITALRKQITAIIKSIIAQIQLQISQKQQAALNTAPPQQFTLQPDQPTNTNTNANTNTNTNQNTTTETTTTDSEKAKARAALIAQIRQKITQIQQKIIRAQIQQTQTKIQNQNQQQ